MIQYLPLNRMPAVDGNVVQVATGLSSKKQTTSTSVIKMWKKNVLYSPRTVGEFWESA